MSSPFILLILICSLAVIIAIISLLNYLKLIKQFDNNQQITQQLPYIQNLLHQYQNTQQEQRERFDQHQIKTLTIIQDSLIKGIQNVQTQISNTLTQHANTLTKEMNALTETTGNKLKDIHTEVNRRLTEGFEKTTATFASVIQRLTIIDQAQKKITELSNNVITLQDILSDKRSRGALGEVQLTHLIHNVLPKSHYALQHTLSNGKRCDCILFLPEPTGHMVIDAKFPLENYQKMLTHTLPAPEKRQASQQFKQDISKHIQDIAQKYILPNETADGAIMFIPSESIFSEIHANYPELVNKAHQSRVWLASPTTMMAILTTARAVLKDADTRKQLHVIQKHLFALSKDFNRFQKRMDNLSRHIHMAHEDISQVHQSSKKITHRFQEIEAVELTTQDTLEKESH